MKSQNYYKLGFTFVFGVIALAEIGSFASAQDRRESRDNNQNQQKQNRLPAHQDQYDQQKAQNQQRFEQRQQSYQNFHQQRMNNQTVTNQPNAPLQQPTRNQDQRVRNEERIVTNQPNEQPPNQTLRDDRNRQKQYAQRQINDRERQQIQTQIGNWDKNEKTWQTQYDSRWRQSQNLFEERARLLQQQNRLNQFAFQQAYWDRVREDRNRLQNWQFYNDVALDYSYLRGGHYYYTSQYGLNLLRDAVSDGYQEGYLAGQADREDRYRFDFRDALAYQDASYGYNGYWVDLSEYQNYFRQGFQNGYNDGFYNRSQYGSYANGGFIVNASVLRGLLNVTYIGS